eukprot:tig00001249_g7775.t1
MLSKAERDACTLSTYIYLPVLRRSLNVWVYRSIDWKSDDGSLVDYRTRFRSSRTALSRGFVLDVDAEDNVYFAFDPQIFPSGEHRVRRILCDWAARKIERRLLDRQVSFADASLAPAREAGGPLPAYDIAGYARLVAGERPGADGRIRRWRNRPCDLVAARFRAGSSPAAASAFARVASAADRTLRGAKSSSPNFVRVYDYFLLSGGRGGVVGAGDENGKEGAGPVTVAVVQEATDLDLQTFLQWCSFEGQPEAYEALLRGLVAQVLAALHAAQAARLPVAGSPHVRAPLGYFHGSLTRPPSSSSSRRLSAPPSRGGRCCGRTRSRGACGSRFLLYRFASAAERGEGPPPPGAPPLRGPFAAISGTLLTGHAPSVERVLFSARGRGGGEGTCATLFGAGPGSPADAIATMHSRRPGARSPSSSSGASPSPSSSSSEDEEAEADASLASSLQYRPVPPRVSAWVAGAPAGFPDDLSSVPPASGGPSAPQSSPPTARGPAPRPLAAPAAAPAAPRRRREQRPSAGGSSQGKGSPAKEDDGEGRWDDEPPSPAPTRRTRPAPTPSPPPSSPPGDPVPTSTSAPPRAGPSSRSLQRPADPAALSRRLLAAAAASPSSKGPQPMVSMDPAPLGPRNRGPPSVASAYPAAREPAAAPSLRPAGGSSASSARSLRSLALGGAQSAGASRPRRGLLTPAQIAASPASRSRTVDVEGRLSPSPATGHQHPRAASGAPLPLGTGQDVRRFGASLYLLLSALEGQNGPVPAQLRDLLGAMVGPELTLEELDEWGPGELDPAKEAARKEPPPPRALLEHPFLAPLRILPCPDARTPADFPPRGATLAFVEHPDDPCLPPPPGP